MDPLATAFAEMLPKPKYATQAESDAALEQRIAEAEANRQNYQALVEQHGHNKAADIALDRAMGINTEPTLAEKLAAAEARAAKAEAKVKAVADEYGLDDDTITELTTSEKETTDAN